MDRGLRAASGGEAGQGAPRADAGIRAGRAGGGPRAGKAGGGTGAGKAGGGPGAGKAGGGLGAGKAGGGPGAGKAGGGLGAGKAGGARAAAGDAALPDDFAPGPRGPGKKGRGLGLKAAARAAGLGPGRKAGGGKLRAAAAARRAREAEAAGAPLAPPVPSPAAAPAGVAPPLPGMAPAPGDTAILPRAGQALVPPAGTGLRRTAAAPALPALNRRPPPPARPGQRRLIGALRLEDALEGSVVLPPARMRRRHRGIIASFLLVVLLPLMVIGAYLGTVARDQYASNVAFSVRKEETTSSLDIMGGITQLAGSSTSDSDILYEFIRSQDMVARVDARVDLRRIWSQAWPGDPVFAFNPRGTIEDLHSHWLRMVKMAYDSGTGIITLRVNAFDPVAAQAIAAAIHAESNTLINALSEEARADATRHAAAERDRAMARLTEARQAMTAFRLRTQIVDINTDLQGQMGILTTLQAQLAEVLIELDLLREGTQAGDPRIRQAERRIEVIEARIKAERAKFGEGGQGPGGEDYARIAAEFERLTIEREFAETTFRSAQSAWEGAVSEAQRQSRYLAAHIRPTLAEQALYPQRMVIFGLSGFFLLVFWGLGVLVYYSIRDRR